MKRILVALAILLVSSAAFAQPGNTPVQPVPPEQVPPPQDPATQGAPVPPEQPPQNEVNYEDLIARAQAASPTLEKVGRGMLRRARRSVAIGPTLGVWGGRVIAQDEMEGAITFGLGIETFKVPILPSIETLKQLVMERAKAKLKEQVIARFQGQQPEPLALEQFAKEVWEEAVNEVLDLQNLHARRIERPALNFGVEVNRLFNSETWTPRLRFGVGFKKITLGASLAFPLGGDSGLFENRPVMLGFEAVLHIMMSQEARSSVTDVFVRVDLEMRNRDTNTDMLVVGLRYLLDIL